MSLNGESKVDFKDFVGAALDGWDVLQYAVAHGYGGSQSREKAGWMIDTICQFFAQNRDLFPEEVENFIAEIMDNEFQLILEDDSLGGLSKTLCQAFSLRGDKNAAILNELYADLKQKGEKLRERYQILTGGHHDDSDSSSDDEQEMGAVTPDDGQNQTPAQNLLNQRISRNETTDSSSQKTDEDGWTVVSRKKK